MAWRQVDRTAAKTAIFTARRKGLTLAAASTEAGVHIATACRWQATDEGFARDLREADTAARRERYAPRVAEYLAGVADGLRQHGWDRHIEPERSYVKMSDISCCHISTPLHIDTKEKRISLLTSIPLLRVTHTLI